MSEDTELEREREDAADASLSPQISSAIDKILANPELITMVASALGGSAAEKKPSPEAKDETAAVAQNDDISEKLPDIMATLAPLMTSLQGKSLAKPSPRQDRRSCLLNALKPYLCRERCEAIDYMIKLGRISELFKTII